MEVRWLEVEVEVEVGTKKVGGEGARVGVGVREDYWFRLGCLRNEAKHKK